MHRIKISVFQDVADTCITSLATGERLRNVTALRFNPNITAVEIEAAKLDDDEERLPMLIGNGPLVITQAGKPVASIKFETMTVVPVVFDTEAKHEHRAVKEMVVLRGARFEIDAR